LIVEGKINELVKFPCNSATVFGKARHDWGGCREDEIYAPRGFELTDVKRTFLSGDCDQCHERPEAIEERMRSQDSDGAFNYEADND